MTWNCQGGFHHKAQAIEVLQPDLAIIQECESPERLQAAGPEWTRRSIVWCGNVPTKGLAVVSFSGARLAVDPGHDLSLKYVLPVVVTDEPSFHLLAVWTKENGTNQEWYIGQACLGIQKYAPFIAGCEAIVAGDFNSSQAWDRPDRPYQHTDMVRALATHGLISVYHRYYRENQGSETRSTFYTARKKERGFHIHHCFLPEAWMPHVRSVKVGNYEDWRPLSDHCPIVVDIDFSAKKLVIRNWLQRMMHR